VLAIAIVIVGCSPPRDAAREVVAVPDSVLTRPRTPETALDSAVMALRQAMYPGEFEYMERLAYTGIPGLQAFGTKPANATDAAQVNLYQTTCGRFVLVHCERPKVVDNPRQYDRRMYVLTATREAIAVDSVSWEIVNFVLPVLAGQTAQVTAMQSERREQLAAHDSVVAVARAVRDSIAARKEAFRDSTARANLENAVAEALRQGRD